MPVLYNTNTGFAEDLPQQAADAALQQGTHEIPLVDPEGQAVSAPLSDVHEFLKQGYRQPETAHLQNLLDYAKYNRPEEQAKAFAEGAAKAATFGLSTAAERALGVKPEAIRHRAEYNPGTEMAGEAAGLLGSSLVPGAGAAVGAAGKAAQTALGLGEQVGSSFLRKAASGAVKGAVESAMVQSGNELSKMFAEDPNQSAESAIADIGLAGVLGGGLGIGLEGVLPSAAQKLKDSKVGEFIGMLRHKALSSEEARIASETAQAAGVELPPEIRAAILTKKGNEVGAELAESSTRAGDKYRESVAHTYNDTIDKALGALGKTREDIGEAPSAFEHGQELVKGLQGAIKERVAPISEQFEKVKARFAPEELDASTKTEIAEKLHKLAHDEGYHLSESSPALKELNRIHSDLPNIRTLEDLRKYQAVARENAMSTQVPGLARKVSRVLRDAEEAAVEGKLGSEAPELLDTHRAARAQYKELMDHLDELNDRLHVGPYHGPDSFVKALGEAQPERVLQRLAGQKDAGLLNLLREHFPQVAKGVKQFHVNTLLSKLPHPNPDKLNINQMLKAVDQMSPELKDFILPEQSQKTLAAAKTILGALPERINPPGTARTLDALLKHHSAGVGGIIGGLMGHGVLGVVLGMAARLLGREAPDAVKLAMLKAIGTEGPVNVEGFNAMLKLATAAEKTQKALRSGVAATIADSSDWAVPKHMMPSAADNNKLDKHVQYASQDPEHIVHVSSGAGHYLPDQAAATAASLSKATQYLNSIRPSTAPLSPLGPPRVPSDAEKGRYERALTIANQPLMVLQHVKDGSLTVDDVRTISTIYPALYEGMKNKLMNEVLEQHAKGKIIPFRKIQSLSLFLGTTLDASLSPQGIALNQPQGSPAPSSQQAPKGHSKGSPKALKTISGMASTPAQAREQYRTAK